ncbi:FtsH protease activity modulator HflK [Chromobacterium haemolyticum]|uniref:Protein HflK n=1 Tax=Chromobacterium haemolyticum TaxID=394935 RepID=A0ABS3GP61_9NEIS|nr:FtsH protease activity modulator HflK [Chromobacterium haemolyticum]MBK0415469.1 FtsH protease activity modulator HflK [Chromobacterium haemolyticum]MBO0416850.1 FtsH protease activity modulator HflK [Chromobacterium haemolyticum]MBO0499962.1 FtsH protease activity modulator HflK [Chromobacterium haemolyticum]
MSQNDPNRGRRGNEGPPDLDEVFRNLNQKLSRLLGAKGSGAGGGPASSVKPPFKGGAVAVVGVLAALWLASGFYVVDAREQGVVLRLGSFNRVTEPGLQWHAPFPIEKVEIVNLTEVRSVEVGYRNTAQTRVAEESLMLTSDQNIIDVQLSVQYDIKDARAFLFNNAARERDAKDIVKQATETAIREVVGRNKVDFVLNEGRTQIAVETQKLIQEVLDRYSLGVRIAKVNINAVQPPEQVLAAFDDAVKAGQDKDKLRNEGLAYANEVLPKAQGLAARLQQEAEAYEQKVVSRAEGDASRFKQVLSEYNKAPKVMRDRLYLDMMQQIMSSTTKVVVDQKGGNNLLYLPLDKLIQQSSPGASGAAAPAAGTAPQPPEPTPPAAQAGSGKGGRDVTRGRDFFGAER